MVFTNTSKLDFYLPSGFHLLFVCIVLLKGRRVLCGALKESCVYAKVGNGEKGKMCYSVATLPPSISYPDKIHLFLKKNKT